MADITVAVVGGGIAGLTAALRLAERGYTVKVFERATYLGGKLGAHRQRYFRVELGKKVATKVGKEVATKVGTAEIAEIRASFEKEKLPSMVKRHLNRALAAWNDPAIKALTGVDEPHLSRIQTMVDPGSTATGQHAVEQWAFEDSGAPRTSRDRGLEQPDRRKYIVTLYQPKSTREGNSGEASKPEPRPRLEVTDDVHHEHCYHMFLSWYHNFWRLMEDIGIERGRDFTPRDNLVHLFPGKAAIPERSHELREYGSFESLAKNLLSGVAPVPDVLLWLYSLADLVGQPFNPARYLDIVSVHGFMTSRWYGTALSAELHQHMLAKAFAVPSYFSSARSYRSFVEYSMRDPHPLLWVMNGNSNERLFLRLEKRLRSCEPKCVIETGVRVTEIRFQPSGRLTVKWVPWDAYDPESPELTRPIEEEELERPEKEGSGVKPEPPDTFDYVILAVPPAALADLVEPFREKVPGLSSVRKLQSGVTASLDLYFKRRLPDDLPSDHVVLRDSKYGLTFIDNSQAWRDDSNLQPLPAASDGESEISGRNSESEDGAGSAGPTGNRHCTCLNVAATDFYSIEGMDKQEAMYAIVNELRRYIAFEYQDVDWGRTYLQMNQNDPLFVNEVGSELWQPDAVTEIPNLFLAGDFCDNPIGVVTVEAAVVTGLQAACAVQARVRVRGEARAVDKQLRPIEILEPEAYPKVNAKALKLMLTPYALAAKAWSRAKDIADSPARALSPREISAMGVELASAPGAIAADYVSFAVDAMRWMADVAYRDDPPNG